MYQYIEEWVSEKRELLESDAPEQSFEKESYKSLQERKCPTFGKEMRKEFLLDEDLIYIAHGSYGAAPKVVNKVLTKWTRHMESQPV